MAAAPPKPWEGASIDAPELQQSSAQTGDTTQPVVPPRPANLVNQNPMYDNSEYISMHISDISNEVQQLIIQCINHILMPVSAVECTEEMPLVEVTGM